MESKAISFVSRREKESKIQRRRGVRAMKELNRQATSGWPPRTVFAAV